jgi:Glycosyltransferase family 87
VTATTGSSTRRLQVIQWWGLVPLVIVGIALLVFGAHALTSRSFYDWRSYYEGPDLAWRTGNPSAANPWTGTPALALFFAPFTQVVTESQGAWLNTVANMVLAAGLAVAAWRYMTRRLTNRLVAAAILIALVVWAPLASSIWWKQVNLLPLALAVSGFAAMRRERGGWAAFLIGLGIALKPLALLLPLFMLAFRETRRIALGAIAWILGLTGAGLLFFAVRAGDVSAADPLEYYRIFHDKAGDPNGVLACNPFNVAPTAAVCRLVGTQGFGITRLMVLAGIAVLVVLALGSLRGRSGKSWYVLAWACLLSPMLSPIEWSHYALMFAPMLLLLAVRFWEQRARFELWVALVAAYALTDLVWTPVDSGSDVLRLIVIGSLGQFLLVLVAYAGITARPQISAAQPSHGVTSTA